MEELWEILELEIGFTISEKDRAIISSMATVEFLRSDVKYRDVGGTLYTKDPCEYRRKLYKKITEGYMRRKHAQPSDTTDPKQ